MPPKKQRLIVSPVGVSLFFNSLEGDNQLRNRLKEYSNAAEIPSDINAKFTPLFERAIKKLRNSSIKQRRLLSAELNGLYALYENNLCKTKDIHYFVATDTVLGKKAAEIIERFLREEEDVENISQISPQKLSTANLSNFSTGIKNLLNEFEKTIPGYVEKEYEVIFNLTGGFKSLQGYLSIIGMFYAERMVYIFEGSEELLEIPRLPLQINEDNLAKNAHELARLAAGGIYKRSDLALKGALLNMDEKGDATLSEWGELIWIQIKEKILEDKLLDFPYLVYEKSFRNDFEAQKELRVKLQEALAQASVGLEDGGINTLRRSGGLKYDNYAGRKLVDGAPLGHFRIDRGNRITCIYRDRKLYLRHFGSHDYTEKKELA